MKLRIALFAGLIAFTLAAVSAANFVKANPQEVFKSTGLSVVVTSTGAGTEATSATLATAGTGESTGRYMRLVWLSGSTGFVGFSCGTYSATTCLTATTQSGTAVTSPIFINGSTDMIVDAGRDAPLVHVISADGRISVLIETVDRVQ